MVAVREGIERRRREALLYCLFSSIEDEACVGGGDEQDDYLWSGLEREIAGCEEVVRG